MTTITNFLQSNFIDSMENRDSQISQNPIWVLNVPNSSQLNQTTLKQYIINHAAQSIKPLIHIDLGISLIKKYPSTQFKSVELQNGLKLCQPIEGKPYFMVRTPISLRTQNNFLQKLINQINGLSQSQIFKKLLTASNLAKKYEGKFCLVIQGIQAMLLLNKDKQVESFISQLSNLHQSIKQVSIFTQQKLINKELMFTLERISTCLTTLTTFDSIEGAWQCVSTVRRYTGYSNEQIYKLTLSKTSQKIKVTKKQATVQLNKQTKQQKQMVQSLGFVVKKKQKDQEVPEEIRKMIYPHLKVIQQCQCNKSYCQNSNCCNKNTQNPDEGLIILDDQQQDQDDIDV